MDNARFFHYKIGNSILHKLPAWIKLLLILVLSILAFFTPIKVFLLIYPSLILLSFFVLNFTISEIISDLKPTIVYTFLLSIATAILMLPNIINHKEIDIKSLQNYIPLLCHLALSLEITAIFYRTTSIAQFKDGFSTIERFFTRKQQTPISDTLALTISFIPRISTFWNRIEKAWKARSGKENITKILKLVPRLFQVSMREGYEKSLAIENRQ